MDGKQAILTSLAQADAIVNGYLKDLSPAEMVARACDGNNHIAWQMGHLIVSEHYLVDKVAPGAMRPLPADFAERHKKQTSSTNELASFETKERYLELMKQVRADTINVIEKISASDLDKPITSGVPPFCKTAGDVLVFLGTHWVMHAGQWAVTRRKLGRAPLF
jgi:hypothetical protein